MEQLWTFSQVYVNDPNCCYGDIDIVTMGHGHMIYVSNVLHMVTIYVGHSHMIVTMFPYDWLYDLYGFILLLVNIVNMGQPYQPLFFIKQLYCHYILSQ